jgi:AcrR family transcriptional regulator
MPAKRRAKSPPKPASQRLIDATLSLAESQGWRRLDMAAIAAAADVPLDEAHSLYRSKYAVLSAFRHGIDEAVLAGGVVTGDDPRDRLFDVLMRRLEALQPNRASLRIILRESVGDPALIRSVPGLMRSMSWMLGAAGLPSGGCRGHLSCRALAALYVSVLPTFYRDESTDLGTTMVALDRRLRQVESMLGFLKPVFSGVKSTS